MLYNIYNNYRFIILKKVNFVKSDVDFRMNEINKIKIRFYKINFIT